MTISVFNIGTGSASTTAGTVAVSIAVPSGGIPAGSLIFGFAYDTDNSITSFSVTDSASNAYNVPISEPQPSGRGTCYFAYAYNTSALSSGQTVVFHFTVSANAQHIACAAGYATGILASSDPYDTGFAAKNSGTSANSTVTSAAAPAVSGSLVVGSVCVFQGTPSADGSYTTPPFSNAGDSSNTAFVVGGWKISSAISSFTCSAAGGASKTWATIIVAFAPTAPVVIPWRRRLLAVPTRPEEIIIPRRFGPATPPPPAPPLPVVRRPAAEALAPEEIVRRRRVSSIVEPPPSPPARRLVIPPAPPEEIIRPRKRPAIAPSPTPPPPVVGLPWRRRLLEALAEPEEILRAARFYAALTAIPIPPGPGGSNARASQVVLEVLIQGGNVRASQVVLEVLSRITQPIPPGPGGIVLPIFPTGPGVAGPVGKLVAWPFLKRAQFGTRVQRAISGRELRWLDQGLPVWTWTLIFPVLRDSNDARQPGNSGYQEFRTLLDFFEVAQGANGLFAFDDVTDDTAVGQLLFIGDGVTSVYQAQRTFGGFTEPVTVLATVSALYYDGSPQSGFAWDRSTGLITATAPAGVGVTVTADFIYYFRCRFSDDTEDFENFMLDLWQLGICKIQSVPFWRTR